MSELTVNINGMTCQHCVMRVKKAIDSLNGVNSSEVDLGKAVLNIDESKVTKEAVEKAVIEAGYSVKEG